VLSQATARSLVPHGRISGAIPKLAFNARLLGGLFMGSLAATATLPTSPADSDTKNRPWWTNPFMRIPMEDDSMQESGTLLSEQRTTVSPASQSGLSKHDPLTQWATITDSKKGGECAETEATAAKGGEEAALLAFTGLVSKPHPDTGMAPSTQANGRLLSRDCRSSSAGKAIGPGHVQQSNPPAMAPLMDNDAALFAYAMTGDVSSGTK